MPRRGAAEGTRPAHPSMPGFQPPDVRHGTRRAAAQPAVPGADGSAPARLPGATAGEEAASLRTLVGLGSGRVCGAVCKRFGFLREAG